MSNLKPSVYNYILKHGENNLIFNTLNRTMAELSDSELYTMNDIVNSSENNNFIQQLIRLGMVVPSYLDERSYLHYFVSSKKFSPRHLALTIAPTLSCNFRCSYCYERGAFQNIAMSDETIDDILEYARKKLEKADNLHVCWYGGEPLLAIPQIKKLSDGFISLCNERKKGYEAFIVTNGYNLNASVIRVLLDARVTGCQITLDGSKGFHDRRRRHISGKGTFDTITNNLRENYDILPKISIRANIDKDNCKGFKDLLETIKHIDKLGKIRIYAAPVVNINGTYFGDKCMDELEFNEFMLSNESRKSFDDFVSELPMIKGPFCGADSDSCIVIGPDGSTYRCWSDLGRSDRKTGQIGETAKQLSKADALYMLNDPFLIQECACCELLPICYGGCPMMRYYEGRPECMKKNLNLLDAKILNLAESTKD